MKHVCGSLNLYFLSLYLQFQSFKHGRKYEEECFVRKLSLTTLCFVKFSHSLMLTCALLHKNMNETKRINAQLSLPFQNKFTRLILHARTRLDTVAHGHTRSDITAHGWTYCSKNAVHSGTRSYTLEHSTAHTHKKYF